MFALQLSERIARVLEELHLRQVGAQRVGGRRHCCNRGVTGLLGGMAFGDVGHGRSKGSSRCLQRRGAKRQQAAGHDHVGQERAGLGRPVLGLMARFFGRMARFFGGLPKRFPLLSDRLELTPNALTYFPRLLGQHTEVFSRRPGRFRLDAALFDTARSADSQPMKHST